MESLSIAVNADRLFFWKLKTVHLSFALFENVNSDFFFIYERSESVHFIFIRLKEHKESQISVFLWKVFCLVSGFNFLDTALKTQGPVHNWIKVLIMMNIESVIKVAKNTKLKIYTFSHFFEISVSVANF